MLHDTLKTVLSVTGLSKNLGYQQIDKGKPHPRTGNEGPGAAEV
jgi:hypothetical protein